MMDFGNERNGQMSFDCYTNEWNVAAHRQCFNRFDKYLCMYDEWS